MLIPALDPLLVVSDARYKKSFLRHWSFICLFTIYVVDKQENRARCYVFIDASSAFIKLVRYLPFC